MDKGKRNLKDYLESLEKNLEKEKVFTIFYNILS